MDHQGHFTLAAGPVRYLDEGALISYPFEKLNFAL
jgi:hypothetical protein